MVPSNSHVVARANGGTALPHQNRAGEHNLTVAALHAKPLASAVATVSGAPHSLLMCHGALLRSALFRCDFFRRDLSRRACVWSDRFRLDLVRPGLARRVTIWSDDVADAHQRHQLAMAGLATVAHLRLVLEDDELLALALLDDLTEHFRAVDPGISELGFPVRVAEHQDPSDFDLVAGLAAEPLHLDD